MSLINDMLRDLEQRRQQEAQQVPVSSPAAVARKSAIKRPTLVAGALVLALMILLVAGWTYYLPTGSPAPLVVATPAVHDEAIAALPPPPPAPVQKPEPLPPASPVLTAVNLVHTARQLQIELTFNLLPAGAEIRSLPGEGRVLIHLPATQLKQGVTLPLGQKERVSNLSLVPTSAGLDLIVALAAAQHIATSQHFEHHSSTLVIGIDFPGARPVEGVPGAEVLTEKTTAVSRPATATPLSVAPASTPIRTQSAPETDEQQYQRGRRQVRQGDLRAAQESFAGVLRTNAHHLAARLELVGVLQHTADEQGALRVLAEGLQLHPEQPELRKLFAHHLLQQQRHQDALTQLEQVPVPAVAADPDYHALRAAIYQELGDYSQAAQLYARLLEQRPREPLWWLGLAIALEQQGLFSGARDAYQTALDVSGLRPDLEKFVRERLQQM